MGPSGKLWFASLHPPQIEREYRARFLREDGRTAAADIVGITLLVSVFVLSDVRFASDPAVVRMLVTGRVVFLLLSAALAWKAFRASRPATMDAAVLAWALAVAVLSLGVQSTRPADYYLPLVADIATVTVVWTMLPNRFALQALAGLAMTVESLVVLIAFREPLTAPGVRLIVVGLAGANFAGAHLSRRAHRSRRSVFLEQRESAAAQLALRESEEKYRNLVDNLHAGVVLHAADTSILLANAQASAMLGLSLDQMRGKVAMDPAWRFVREDLTTMPIEEYPVARVLATGAPVVNQVIGADRPATGDRAWALVNAYPVFRVPGELLHVVVTFVDITQRRGLEAQLAVGSRLASLGTLVAGVAHEINNPLTSEMAGQGLALEEVESVQRLLRSGEPIDREEVARRLGEVLEALRDAQAGGERIARIVKDLTLFGRPDPKRTRVRLMDVVEEGMRWLPKSISRSVAVQVDNRGAPDVTASRGQLGQVLVNLVTNAAKAIPEDRRGTITIRLGACSPGMAWLEVIDDGVGMKPEILGRIFDPFFTTRQVGQGAGLGLPICHAIVSAHGGTLVARSEPDQGSTFRVELPAAAEEA